MHYNCSCRRRETEVKDGEKYLAVCLRNQSLYPEYSFSSEFVGLIICIDCASGNHEATQSEVCEDEAVLALLAVEHLDSVQDRVARLAAQGFRVVKV